MREKQMSSPIRSILILYLSCYIFRVIEYLFIRTDQSVFGEAFLHKLIGIVILAVAVKYFLLNWREIGFTAQAVGKKTAFGLLLGLSVFAVAYGVEILAQTMQDQTPTLQLYVTAYALDGNQGYQAGLLFFALCIVGNLINVCMEEGMFRGLFLRLAETKVTFVKAVLLSSALFGLWHIAAPMRSLIDGEMSVAGAVMSALVLVITTGLGGIKFCLLTKITGSLWVPMADHFVNNTIINVLHVVTSSGADELQMVRITIAQTVSFLIVLVLYRKTGSGRKPTFRA